MSRLQANICLLVVTLLWSSEVVIFSVIPSDVPSWATMCVTSLIGAALLWACFAKRITQMIRSDGARMIRRAALLSALNATYNALIIMSLDYFNVTTGAFTLSMTMVVLPVLLITMHRAVPVRTWISALIVLAGMLVAVMPTFTMPQLPGLVIMFVSCVMRGIFIVKLNDYAREHDPVALSTSMVSFSALFSFIPWVIVQPATFAAMPWTPPVIAALFIYAYFVVAFVMVINFFAQRRTTPAEATIIYAVEIVFSVLWATFLPPNIVEPNPLTLTTVLGCVLIVLGNVIEIVHFGKRDDEDERASEPSASAQLETVEGAQFGRQVGTGSDAISALLGRIRQPAMRKLVLFVVLLGVYLIVAIPFKVLVVIPGFSDVRPVDMLQPVYGIFFGIPGCLAFAVGNLIGDIASGSLRISSIAGFVGNFAFPYLMYLFWTRLQKERFNVRTGRMVGLFCVSVFVCACVKSLIISPAVGLYYPNVDLGLFALSVIANSTVFPICLAIPFISLIQDELGFAPLRKNE